MAEADGNPGPGLGQAQRYGGVEPVNGIPTLLVFRSPKSNQKIIKTVIIDNLNTHTYMTSHLLACYRHSNKMWQGWISFIDSNFLVK